MTTIPIQPICRHRPITITEVSVDQPTMFVGEEPIPDPKWRYIGADGTVYKWGKNGVVPELAIRMETKYRDCECCGGVEKYEESYTVDPADEDIIVEPGYKYKRRRDIVTGPRKMTGSFESTRRLEVLKKYNFATCNYPDGIKISGRFIVTSVDWAEGVEGCIGEFFSENFRMMKVDENDRKD